MRIGLNRAIPIRVSIHLGEYLYQLRSVLDASAYAACVHESGEYPPPNEVQIQYPVCSQASQWDGAISRIRPLRDFQLGAIRSGQPFQRPDPKIVTLYWINHLARVDRHRHLTLAAALIAESDILTRTSPSDLSVRVEVTNRVIGAGNDELARIVVDEWTSDCELDANPQAGIDLHIQEWGDAGVWASGMPFAEKLDMMHFTVTGALAALEYTCHPSERAGRLLADSFRDECDRERVSA